VADAVRASERATSPVVAAAPVETPRAVRDAVQPAIVETKPRAVRRQEPPRPRGEGVSAGEVVMVLPAETTLAVPQEPAEVSVKAPSLEASKVFEGLYSEPGKLPGRTVRPSVTPWQAASDAGVGIGSATRKASVSVADAVTKAGTAVARSF
jgi:hypothetical protein